MLWCVPKRPGPPMTHQFSLVDWKISYPFHHIAHDFLRPLPTSYGYQFNLLNGDHFTKWYEARLLPDQQALTKANFLLEHWICRFWCHYSIHTDQGLNFEPDVSTIDTPSNWQNAQNLLPFPVYFSHRTHEPHPLEHAYKEHWQGASPMVLLSPSVLMAQRYSMHESTGFTPNFLVWSWPLASSSSDVPSPKN